METASLPSNATALPPSPVWLRSFRRKLRTWFDRNARELPWRGTRDPYAIWLSEIMLQQTQVETVKPYFQRFIAALPTIAALAAADEQQVLRLWEGLGYYRRARQLHATARRIVAEHDGRFPTDPRQSRICRALAATRPGRSFPSPSTSGGRSWRPTQFASSAVCWPMTGKPLPRPGKSCSGRRPKRCCPHGTRASSTRR